MFGFGQREIVNTSTTFLQKLSLELFTLFVINFKTIAILSIISETNWYCCCISVCDRRYKWKPLCSIDFVKPCIVLLG